MKNRSALKFRDKGASDVSVLQVTTGSGKTLAF